MFSHVLGCVPLAALRLAPIYATSGLYGLGVGMTGAIKIQHEKHFCGWTQWLAVLGAVTLSHVLSATQGLAKFAVPLNMTGARLGVQDLLLEREVVVL